MLKYNYATQTSDVVRESLELKTFDLWTLCISIVIGGQYFGWNIGLEMGVGSYLIAFFVIALGYFSLTCCLAEISSIAPFGGILLL